MYFNIPWATKSNPDLIFSSLNVIFLHLIVSRWRERNFANVSDINRSNHLVLRLVLFAFGPFQTFLTIFDRSALHER